MYKISRALHRSVSGQIEYWAKIDKIAEENPDVTYEFMQKLLIAREESFAGDIKPYEFDVVWRL